MKIVIVFIFMFLCNTAYAANQEYRNAVKDAANLVGVEEALLLAIAHKESNFRNIRAKAGGSAEGLLQITDKTWEYLLSKYANDYLVALDASKYDPWSNAVMAAAYVKENQNSLRRVLGRKPTNGEVYMAHLLGLKGASDVLRANTNVCTTNVVAYAIKRNSRLFKKSSGGWRTTGQFRDYMNWKFNKITEHYKVVI